MILKKIKFLKTSPFQPHTKPTKKVIKNEIKLYLMILPTIIKENKLIFNKIRKDNFDDLRLLSEFFNVKLSLRKKMKTGGLAYVKGRKISLNLFRTKTKQTIRTNSNTLRRYFCHELGHIFQGDFNFWADEFPMSEALQCEQEAEAISVELFKLFWPNNHLCKHKFNKYYKEEDIIWLYNYYKEGYYKGYTFENDLFTFIDGKDKTT